MSRAVALGLLLAVAVAFALRCPQPGVRPMHNDEAVNALKFRDLWEHGDYQYNPNEYHGPTLHYATLAWSKLTRAPDFAHFDEARLRFVTVLFGVGLILLLPFVADGLGRNATVWAGLLTAVSPAMVFYSRYFIHEMPLVFFTFLALAAGWRYSRNRKIGWALLAGAAVGLMQSTKETFVLALAAMAAALALNATWMRWIEAPAPAPPQKLNLKHATAAFGVWLAVALILFSSFFTNAAGPLDAVRTYLPWLHRAEGASPHLHPWNFYLERVLWFHTRAGPIWSEALILALALVGTFAAFARKGLGDANAGFVRFLALYTLILTLLYSTIAYKTPWCLLNFWHGMILLAGAGAAVLLHWARGRFLKLAVGVLLLAGTGQLARQGWQAAIVCFQPSDHPHPDPCNPYVYSQTSPDILKLVAKLNDLARMSPGGPHTLIKVMAPDSDYWPLPWYLRGFDQIGWWAGLPPDPFAPVMIVSTKFDARLDEKKTHVMVGMYEMRPQTFFELYVELDLWRAYLKTAHPDSE